MVNKWWGEGERVGGQSEHSHLCCSHILSQFLARENSGTEILGWVGAVLISHKSLSKFHKHICYNQYHFSSDIFNPSMSEISSQALSR